MKKFFTGVCLLMLVSGLVACGESNETKGNAGEPAAETVSGDSGSEQKETSTATDNSKEDSTENEESEKDGSEEKDAETETTEGSVSIVSSADAIEYLKHVLELEDNGDIVFDDMGGTLETDDSGSFYTIKLVSKELQKNGGSGTVGVYKVYEDGTYMEKI
ncbi:hypothetical protein LC085_00120 [Bacillus tianshenii]|uniref:hypothetical protein n=1 Tax=Sutcliffiella tianshenii TaxID=1463404 RepID=UPI001CD81387|nr:hypothetical protein [Bacillus tianshenii]MCA1318299.1 hypothetical protein [Bacillus tianshenii]